jgi:hypothetical protein
MNRDPKYASFNKAISLISDGKYSEALTLLQSKSKESKTIADIIKQLNTDKALSTHPDRLAVVLSYTYGAKDVKNKKTDISSNDYKNAHSQAVQNAEKRLDTKRWNADNEAKFVATDKHTSAPLSQLIPGRDLSVSVFATPLHGTHRIDKFQGSLSVSNNLSFEVTPVQKDALITEHSSRIEKIVSELKGSLALAGKDVTAITVESYKEMLKT